MAEIEVGQSIGRYQLLEKIGEGGMATVYKAYDTELKGPCAIKFVRMEKLESQKALHRFRLEAEVLAKLDHPNIVKNLAYGDHEGTPYLVMDYVSGGTLKKRLGEPIPWKEAITLILPLARALSYAHKQKIIHRDIKPSNILIAGDGRLLLSDFGVAKILELDETLDLTGTGVGVGTPEYMAPEQGRGERVDHRADIYALGVLLYELITGRKPFQADTPMAVIYKHINDPLPRPKQYINSLPDTMEMILFKALQKKPDYRFQDLDELIDDLENLLQDKKIAIKTQPSQFKLFYILLFAGLSLIAVMLAALLFLLLKPPGENQMATANPVNSTQVEIATAAVIPGDIPTSPTVMAEPTRAEGLANIVAYLTDGMSGVYVPAGEFLMGASASDDEADEAEKPQHPVYLDLFIIDSYEITNEMYRKCVSAGGCKAPTLTSSPTRSNYFTDSQYKDYPVLYVDWGMAAAYCSWVGRRLPTEAEWEKAARGPHWQTYPWGEVLDCNYANYGGCVGDTTETRSYPQGKSMYGVYDMAGNVWEWTADWYDQGFYLDTPFKNPAGPGPGTERVLRGGSNKTGGRLVRTTYRRGFDPFADMDDTGFRCADSVEK
jgi:serine/threonine protein kinase